VLNHLAEGQKLLRTWKDGQAKLNGYLEDYANFVEGLLALFEATGARVWLEEAIRFNQTLLDQFWDEASASFYLTGRDHEQLIARMKDFYDNATPAGSSVAVFNLLKLSVLTGESHYRQKAEANLRSMKPALERYPTGFGYLLEAADFFVGPVREIAVIGARQDSATRELLQTVYHRYLPNRIVALCEPSSTDGAADIPLLQGKTLIEGKPTAYVCEDYVCRAPVTRPTDLESLLTKRENK
jgi:uncharacterized protein YyaL (SSP411 family)